MVAIPHLALLLLMVGVEEEARLLRRVHPIVAVLVGLAEALLMVEQAAQVIHLQLHRHKVQVVAMAAPELTLVAVAAVLLRLVLLVALAPQRVMAEMERYQHFQEHP
jgi:hypothetical protein